MRGVAWRLGRRDLLVHRWRSILIVLLVMLPVAAVVAGAVVAQSSQATPQETVSRRLGTTQAVLRLAEPDPDGKGCVQAALYLETSCDGLGTFVPADVPLDPGDAAPPGYRTVGVRSGSVVAQRPVTSGSLPKRVPVTVVDVAAPEFAGRWDLVAGRPAVDAEVVVSRPWQREFGAGIGDTVVTERGTFLIAGIVAAPRLRQSELFVLPTHPIAGNTDAAETYLVGAAPLTWAQVQELNHRGVVALSRAVVLQPPPGAYEDDAARRGTALVAIFGALGGTLLMFVAGSAFAVGVRTSRRQLGLLGAVGADLGVLRRIVLLQALVLGGVGALVGAGLGIAAGIATGALLSGLARATIWGVHVPWPVVAAVVAVGMLACLVAAWSPARSVARVDALEAVRSAEASTPPARLSIPGFIAIAAGLGLMGAAVALWRADDPLSIIPRRQLSFAVAAGTVLLVVGVALSLHPMVALVARRVPRRPLALRLAVRDLDRSRSRVVPAVAAVVTAATLTTVVMGLNAGMVETQRAQRAWRIQPTHVLVGMSMGPTSAAPITAAVERVLGALRATVPLSVGQGALDIPEANRCPQPTTPGRGPDLGDWRCGYRGMGNYPPLVVGGQTEFELLLGRAATREELDALRAGTILTSDPHRVHDGRSTLQLDAGEPVAVAVRLAPSDAPYGWAVLSPEQASSLGVPVSRTEWLFDIGRTPSAAELDELEAGLRDLGYNDLILPRDPNRVENPLGWWAVGIAGLVVFAVVGLTTALGLTESQRDERTLASVGAPAGLCRYTTAAQVLASAALGVVLGVAVGLVTLAAVQHSAPADYLPISYPWLELGAFMVGVPVLCAAFAWLLTPPSRVLAQRSIT